MRLHWYDLRPVASILLWLHSLYYLRAFKATSFYIRMIQEIIADMAPFTAIMAMVMVGLSQSFFLASSLNGDTPFQARLGLKRVCFPGRWIKA